jgi:hypothetical protein
MRKTFAQVREEQRRKDIEEIEIRLTNMGLHREAKLLRMAMTGECHKVWPYIDETRYTLNG